jgi:hypothetical protein
VLFTSIELVVDTLWSVLVRQKFPRSWSKHGTKPSHHTEDILAKLRWHGSAELRALICPSYWFLMEYFLLWLCHYYIHHFVKRWFRYFSPLVFQICVLIKCLVGLSMPRLKWSESETHDISHIWETGAPELHFRQNCDPTSYFPIVFITFTRQKPCCQNAKCS